jgi:peroxiredoxin
MRKMSTHVRLCRFSFGVLMAVLGAGLVVGSAYAQAEDTSPQAQAVAAGRGLIGSVAPPLELETVDGESINLGALYGEKAVYLKFWATWCVPCRRQMPHFESTWRDAGDDLAVIGVNAGFNDSRDDVLRYREELGISMPLVIDDGTLATAFNLRVTPQHIVIGRDGRVQYVGQLADARLDAELRRARVPESAVGTRAVSPETRGGDRPATEIATAIGSPLPDLTLKTVAGDTFAASLRVDGRSGTALVFFIPWCESYWKSSRPETAEACRRVREQVEALRSTYGTLRWLGVSSAIWGTERALLDYQRDYGTTLPLALDADGRWFRVFGVMTVPTIVLADAGGRVVRRVEGYDQDLATAIAASAPLPFGG